PANAIPISFGEIIEDRIDFENEWDTYTFEAEAGDLIWLTMSENSNTNRFFNPYIRLYNPDGTLVGSDNGIYNADLTDIELVQDGTYTIIAGDYYVDDVRDYSLYLQRLNNLRIDPLLGNDSNDFLDEGIGNYRLNGIGDNDSLLNNYTTDPLTASGKQDLIYSETDNYSLFGNDNIDIL
ncbi:MAG: pre-peptidase C-terminal domain-containing protein, partial [Xenococcus sp. (in: cyanobacteria)]